MFWENAVGYLRKQWVIELSNLCHCVQHPWKLTSRDDWSSRNKRKPLSTLKHVLRKCSGICQKLWKLELSNLCHCVQYLWKLTSRDSWSSRNERKPLSKQICVLRKCCRLSQKQWVIELSNLCYCVRSNPEIMLVDNSGVLAIKESHFLSKNMFWENAVWYLRNCEW